MHCMGSSLYVRQSAVSNGFLHRLKRPFGEIVKMIEGDPGTPGQSGAPLNRTRQALSGWAWVPAPLLFASLIGLEAFGPDQSFESWAALFVSSFLFTTVASLVVSVLAARSFLTTRAPGLLFLGMGVLVWGSAGPLGPVVFPNIAGAERLDVLINDVLSYSRVSKGEASLDPVALDQVVATIIREYPDFHSAEKNIEVRGFLPTVIVREFVVVLSLI